MRLFTCTSKPPHNTHNEVTIGTVSIIFSYGRVAGYYAAGISYVAQDVSPVTQRHVNKWRDFRTHNRVPRRELISGLLAALQQEATLLSTAAGEKNVQKPDGQEELQFGDAADEALNAEIDSLDELDDEDLDDEDEDDDDILDDDDEPDDDEDDDDLDDDLVDLDDEDEDLDYRNKY